MPSFLIFALLYCDRFYHDLGWTANTHHFYTPMLMVEHEDLRYIHYRTSSIVKPGTSKYFVALLGWLYLKWAGNLGVLQRV